MFDPRALRSFYTLSWRRGAIVSLIIATTHIAAMLAVPEVWRGIWSQTLAVFGQSLILTLPVAVLLASWHCGQLRQSSLGSLERVSPHSRLKRDLTHTVDFTSFAVVGLAAAALVVGVSTGETASYGGPDLLGLLAVMGWMFVAAAIGRRLSGFGGYAITAPVAGVVTYSCLAFIIVRAEGAAPAALSPFEWRWMSLYAKAGWVSILQAYVSVALGLLVLGLRPGGRALRWSGASIAFTLGLVLLGFGASAARGVDWSAARLRCGTLADGRTVCLPVVKRYLVQQVQIAWRRLDQQAPGLLEGNLVLIDDEARGLSVAIDRQLDDAIARARGQPILLTSTSVDLSAVAQVRQQEFLAQTIDLVIRPQADADGGAEAQDPRQPASPSTVVRRWLYQALNLPADGSAYPGAPQFDSSTVNYSTRQDAMAWFSGLRHDERQQWFEEHRAQLQAGTLSWSAFSVR